MRTPIRTALLLTSALPFMAGAAHAQAFPGFNVKAYCIGQASIQQGPVSPDYMDTCMANEIDAADDLGSIWMALPQNVRQGCIPRETRPDDVIRPGYADMRACVEKLMEM